MFESALFDFRMGWRCGGVRHYNTYPRSSFFEAKLQSSLGTFHARMDEYGEFFCRIDGRDVPVHDVVERAAKVGDEKLVRLAKEVARRVSISREEVVT